MRNKTKENDVENKDIQMINSVLKALIKNNVVNKINVEEYIDDLIDKIKKEK